MDSTLGSGGRMCESCWEAYEYPTIWNPKVERAVALIGTIYETEPTGGILHVVLDDWNIDGEIKAFEPDEDDMPEPEAIAATEELTPLLNEMTVAERASALAYAHGFTTPPSSV